MAHFIICIVLYVIFDELQQHAEKSLFSKGFDNRQTPLIKWLNTKTGWHNKHDWGKTQFTKFLFQTVLVFTTDGEHFFQWLKHIMLALLVLIILPFWWAFIIMAIIGAASFLTNEFILR